MCSRFKLESVSTLSPTTLGLIVLNRYSTALRAGGASLIAGLTRHSSSAYKVSPGCRRLLIGHRLRLFAAVGPVGPDLSRLIIDYL